WAELSKGLNAVVLAPGRWDCYGWHDAGVVNVCAWDRELPQTVQRSWYEANHAFFDRIGLPCEVVEDVCRLAFTEPTVRAFQLLDVLLHELGHHHDRMTTRTQRWSSRGERYAEEYALRYADLIWDRYLKVFDLY